MNALTASPPAVAQVRPNISSSRPHCPTPDPKLTRGGPMTLITGRLQHAQRHGYNARCLVIYIVTWGHGTASVGAISSRLRA